MKCVKVVKQIESLLDGGALGPEALDHIKTCAKCRAEYNTAMSLKDALHSQPDVKCPPDFNKMVWGRIEHRIPETGYRKEQPSVLSRIFQPVNIWRGAAAAALALFLAMFLNDGARNNKTDMANAPAVKKAIQLNKEAAPDPSTGSGQGKREIITAENAGKQEQIAPVPGEMKDEMKPAGGGMPAMAKDAAAEKEYHISNSKQNKVGAAGFDKRTPIISGPIEIRNNVIRPLSGQGMSVVYRVEEPCDVAIIIYNRKGEPVKTLYTGGRGRGVYEERWMGEDKNGFAVGDGIYVVYIKTGLAEQRVKAMVIK